MTSASFCAFRRAPRLLALVIALSVARQAYALPDDTPRRFRIERAPLEHVLLEITRVSGHQVSFASSVVKERWAGPIDGTMSAQEAARQALQGTGLTLAATADGALTVVASDISASPPNVGTLPLSEVRGTTNEGFAEFSTSAITRIEMPMVSMPHAVDTISSGLLSSQQPLSLGAALSQAGVVSVATDPSAPPQYAIRGFMTESISVDGLPDRLAALRPVDAMDEISIIKGPNADVAGVTMAGGAINVSLKEPVGASQRSVAVEAGSHAERKVVADLGGSLGTGGLIYRVVGLQDTSANSEAGYDGHRVSYGHVAFGWHDAATDVTAGVESLSNRQPVQPFTFALGGAPVRLPLQSPLGNSSDGVQNRADRLYYKVSHSLTDDWAVHSRASYENLTVQTDQWILAPMLSGSLPMPMPMLGMDYRANNRLWALSNDLTGTIRQGGVTHSLVLGWDEIQDRQDFQYSGAVALALQNPFAPVPLPPVTSTLGTSVLAAAFAPGTFLSQTVRQSVFRLRDRIAISERWEISGSIRANDYAAKLTTTQFHGLAWTPALGLTYKLNAQTAWFADYSRGFQINTGFFYDGRGTQPERSRQMETGLRWEDRSRQLTMQAVLYRIDADHVSLADTTHLGFYTQISEQTNRGLELSLRGALARGWETSLWLTFARVSGTMPGGFSSRTPTRGGALWTTYTVQGGALAGAGAGLGVTVQGGIMFYGDQPFRVPGSALVDGSLFWHQKHWRVDLFARNLFNVRAYGDTLSSSFIPVQPGRTLALRLTRSF